jgi:cytidylate kinase
VARELARRLNLSYLNTGAMYRAIAWKALQEGIPPDDAERLADLARRMRIEFRDGLDGQRILVDGRDVTEELAAPEITAASSIVSAHPGVRDAMVAQQRRLAVGGGTVVEGRDTTTVVFPDAEVKVFLDASLDERARRKFREFRSRGVEVTFEEVRAAEEARDRRDAGRAHSPLRVAEDAVVIDTTHKTVEQVVQEVLELIRQRSHVV